MIQVLTVVWRPQRGVVDVASGEHVYIIARVFAEGKGGAASDARQVVGIECQLGKASGEVQETLLPPKTAL